MTWEFPIPILITLLALPVSALTLGGDNFTEIGELNLENSSYTIGFNISTIYNNGIYNSSIIENPTIVDSDCLEYLNNNTWYNGTEIGDLMKRCHENKPTPVIFYIEEIKVYSEPLLQKLYHDLKERTGFDFEVLVWRESVPPMILSRVME